MLYFFELTISALLSIFLVFGFMYQPDLPTERQLAFASSYHDACPPPTLVKLWRASPHAGTAALLTKSSAILHDPLDQGNMTRTISVLKFKELHNVQQFDFIMEPVTGPQCTNTRKVAKAEHPDESLRVLVSIHEGKATTADMRYLIALRLTSKRISTKTMLLKRYMGYNPQGIKVHGYPFSCTVKDCIAYMNEIVAQEDPVMANAILNVMIRAVPLEIQVQMSKAYFDLATRSQ